MGWFDLMALRQSRFVLSIRLGCLENARLERWFVWALGKRASVYVCLPRGQMPRIKPLVPWPTIWENKKPPKKTHRRNHFVWAACFHPRSVWYYLNSVRIYKITLSRNHSESHAHRPVPQPTQPARLWKFESLNKWWRSEGRKKTPMATTPIRMCQPKPTRFPCTRAVHVRKTSGGN